MKTTIKTDVCVIGAGSGGLSVAAGTSQLGLSTVLIEKDKMGGDCLNTGCVPSKALLAAAKNAHIKQSSDIPGIAATDPTIDFSTIKHHVSDVIKSIEPNDSQQRFEGLGVTVLRNEARFISPNLIRSGDDVIQAKYVVIATGSRPVIPPIKDINTASPLTNESIFNLSERPKHLLIIGAGPIGIEMAQAHCRLGSQVSVFDMATLLPRDDESNVSTLREVLVNDGINFYERVAIKQIKKENDLITVYLERNEKIFEISGSHLLVSAGRSPVTDTLDLEKAGIKYDKKGISVDKRLRTNKKHIYAIGDVSGGPQFTHIAGYHAGIVIRNICFKIPAKVDYRALPWVTFTDPELAQVGLTEKQAKIEYGNNIKVTQWPFKENDRAIAERTITGNVRVITTRRGHILGASIIGPHAGELCQVWGLAISSRLKIGAIAGMIAPYPTLAEINKRVAGAWFTKNLFSRKTQTLVRLLQKLPF